MRPYAADLGRLARVTIPDTRADPRRRLRSSSAATWRATARGSARDHPADAQGRGRRRRQAARRRCRRFGDDDDDGTADATLAPDAIVTVQLQTAR